MRILISGCGIAGPTLAYWLQRNGHEPTIVEHAPELRGGGYMIDFWGLGYDIADAMGIVPELRELGYFIKDVRFVNSDGRRVGGFPAEVFAKATRDRYVSIRRGDLARALYESIDGRVEAMFGDSIVSIDQRHDRAVVTLASGVVRHFDLVFGAGGLHSKVRELTFGPEAKFERYLGYKVAAFEIPDYQPRDDLVYVLYTEVGKLVAKFAMRDGTTTILFVYADGDTGVPHHLEDQKAVLHRVFDGGGWECRPILEALDKAENVYFDRVSQIEMDHWTSGRCALLGDAAFSPSLLAGEGSALAMVAAYILSGELARADCNYAAAFASYERLMRPFILEKQKAARSFAGTFVPKSGLALFLRNQISRFVGIPFVADIALGRSVKDSLKLPDYAEHGIGRGMNH